jgi:hypothetical protein
MMMKPESIVVAVRRSDGGVSMMALLTVGRGNILPSGATWLEDGWWARPPTDAVINDEVAKAVPDALGWRLVKPGEVPEDRTYRNAWVDNGKIEHDMPKAREVHRGLIRKQRSPALQALDAEWMRATGQGKSKDAAEIEAKRQKWRDAPADPRIDAAKTVEQLKAIG